MPGCPSYGELKELITDVCPIKADFDLRRTNGTAAPDFSRPSVLRIERDEAGDLSQFDEARKLMRAAVVHVQLPVVLRLPEHAEARGKLPELRVPADDRGELLILAADAVRVDATDNQLGLSDRVPGLAIDIDRAGEAVGIQGLGAF